MFLVCQRKSVISGFMMDMSYFKTAVKDFVKNFIAFGMVV